MQALRHIVEQHKSGRALGVYSLCSAHPLVIEAALLESRDSQVPILIEATCNQVNQFGGYTGMRARDFQGFVAGIARQVGVDQSRVALGGDHLGPSPWQAETAAAALDKAATLVDQYVRAGFRKIHLDCSMACADDLPVLSDQEVAARAAGLAEVAERAWQASGGEAPSYVIGTEVPTPGGALEDLDALHVTRPEDVALTLDAHRRAFGAAGVGAAWQRVLGLVVQPGVEFDHEAVVDYAPEKAAALSRAIEAVPGIVYEAHSTDYQLPHKLALLVRDHFAILKVGPAATFALREAYWALSDIEDELIGHEAGSRLKDVLMAAMHADPRHWSRHYRDGARQRLLLQFSFSDRIRYYWPAAAVQAATATLCANLDRVGIPPTLLSQYLPHQYQALREGRIESSVEDLLIEAVGTALRPYIAACANTGETPSA
jgi:D-tagatose-1,6-bisphosphate aldolase subunit GatZ/KbaZ